MSEHRLLDEDDFAARLLREALADAPRAESAAKIAGALAMGTVAKVSVASTAATGISSTTVLAAAASAAGTSAMPVTILSLAKTLGLGALVGTAALGAVSAISELTSRIDRQPVADRVESRSRATPSISRHRERGEPRMTRSAEKSEEMVAAAPAVTQHSISIAGGSNAIGGAHPTSVQPRRDAPVTAWSATPADAVKPAAKSYPSSPLTVADEVTIVDRTRAALSAGRSAEALRLLDEHQSRMTALWIEAEVLRIEGLIRAGNRSSALTLGEQFISTYPGTAHAARVRELLQE